MGTQRTYTAAAPSTVADVISHTGRITVTVDPAATRASVTVSTTDDSGPVADAVRETVFREHGDTLDIHVPRTDAGGAMNSVMVGGMQFTSTGNTGVVMNGDDVFIGGRQVVRNGHVVAQPGTPVIGNGSIEVTLTLPAPQGQLRVETTSASLRVHGDVHNVDIHSVSGAVDLGTVRRLRFSTTSGSVTADRVTEAVDVHSVSGTALIGAYGGRGCRMESVSGSLHLSATPDASGPLTARTVSGSIRLRGTDDLDVRTSTVSGHVTR